MNIKLNVVQNYAGLCSDCNIEASRKKKEKRFWTDNVKPSTIVAFTTIG
jgi:hypothetical protein